MSQTKAAKGMNDVFAQIERNINRLVENEVGWDACATPEQLRAALC